MPYDARKVSEGGNQGIDELFSRKAPKGKYRVIGVDTFDGSDWVVGNYKSLDKAKQIANEKGGQMTCMYVYDDKGKMVYNAGSF